MGKIIGKTELFKKYQGKWLALTDDDKFICAGRTLAKIMQKSKKQGYDQPVTIKVPNFSLELVLYGESN